MPSLDDLEDVKGRLEESGSLIGMSDHGVNKSLYARDPDGLEFEVMWLVPPELWGDEEHEAIIRPLDISADKARYAAAGATMRVAVVTGPGSIELRENAGPKAGAEDVVVEVGACGLCTMERRLFAGEKKIYPVAPGHEAAGRVVDIGSEVATQGGPALGDLVTLDLLTRLRPLPVVPARAERTLLGPAGRRPLRRHDLDGGRPRRDGRRARPQRLGRRRRAG